MYLPITRRFLTGLLVCGLAAFLGTRASAQNQLASLTEVNNDWSKHSAVINRLVGGRAAPSAADKDALDAAAKWLVYRFVVLPLPDKDRMAELRRVFDAQFISLAMNGDAPKTNREFIRQFGPVLVRRYKDLFDQDFSEYRYPIVNAAPTLVLAAKLRDEAICDYLCEIVMDHTAIKGDPIPNKHDAIKLYAIRGMREYFQTAPTPQAPSVPVPVSPVADDAALTAAQEKRKARELRCVKALLSFIEKPLLKTMDDDEQEAVRVLRMEAIETLAMTRAPAVVFGKGKVDAPIAPTLLRVLAPKSGLTPAPGLHERIEAAIGVCQIRIGEVQDYQPELGVHLVGSLLVDYMTEYNKDLVDIKNGKQPYTHWRINARRLEMALDDLVANTPKNTAAEGKALALRKNAAPMLKDMQPKDLQQVQPPQLTLLRDNVLKMRPADTKVFKSIKAYTIDLEK